MHIGLEFLANQLLLVATGARRSALTLPCYVDEGGLLNLKLHPDGHHLWNALETPFLQVLKGPTIPHDIVVDDIIPFPKRVTLAIDYWKSHPTFRVTIERPFAGTKAGPYSAVFELGLAELPTSLRSNQDGQALARWIRQLVMSVYPQALKSQILDGKGPTGIAFLDEAWPSFTVTNDDDMGSESAADLLARAFGIDEIRIVTVFDPRPLVNTGGLESFQLVLSTPEGVRPAPLPFDLPRSFLFALAAEDGCSVEMHFGPDMSRTFAEVEGALLLQDGAHVPIPVLPFTWSSNIPDTVSGSFEVGEDEESAPFNLQAIQATMGDVGSLLAGLELLPIHQAEMSYDHSDGRLSFTGQCTIEGTIEGIRCSEVAIHFETRLVDKAFSVRSIVVEGFAELDEPTFFRAAVVARDGWISVLEANHSSQKWPGPAVLAKLIGALPDYKIPARRVNDSSPEPQLLQLPEQRRGSELDELLED